MVIGVYKVDVVLYDYINLVYADDHRAYYRSTSNRRI